MSIQIKTMTKWGSYKLLYFLLSVVALSSCSQEDEIGNDNDSFLVSFTGRLRSTFDRGNLWYTTDTIGLYMKKNGVALNATGAVLDTGNRMYVADDNDTFYPVSGNEMFYPPNDTQVNFVAYYPYTRQITSDYGVPVNIEDQSSPRKIDLLVSRGITPYSNTNLLNSLTFSHALSELSIYITAGVGFTDSDLSSITAKMVAYPTTAVVSLAQNTVNTFANFKDIPLQKSGRFFDAILIPYVPSGSEKIAVVFTTSTGDEYYWNPAPFVSGTSYNYTIQISKTGIVVQENQVATWALQQIQNGTA